MSKRKGLNSQDLFTNRSSGMMTKATDSWDAFEQKQSKKPKDPYFDDYELDSYYGGKSTKSYYDTFSTGGNFERCYDKHPPLTLPGTDLKIYGGSCSKPVVKDADIYIGFDKSMDFTARHWPWKKGAEVLFYIPDMGIPDKPGEFDKLVEWTKKQLEQGAKVHAGCIGGHGRTGTFLSALVSKFGEKDAIAYVRKHYCPKAVESTSQVNFLNEQFGVMKEKGYKTGGGSTKTTASTPTRTAGIEVFNCISGNDVWGR